MRIRNRISAALAAAVLAVGAAAGAAAAEQERLPPYFAVIRPVSAAELGPSWREGCPLGPGQLRHITLRHVGFDGRVHTGELIVAKAVAVEVARTFKDLYRQRFPVERMENVAEYDADDDKSMAANNTSAFHCRPVTGGGRWSNHSYGRAVDVNPKINPYISGSGTVYPPSGAPYVDRTKQYVGGIYAGDATVLAFERRGWSWGGYWESPVDYQHFEKPVS